MAQFTWIPIYQELAKKLLPYRDRQEELVDILDELEEMDIPTIPPEDRRGKNKTPFRLKVMDPFTFFANFNRNTSEENRRKVLEVLKKRFKLRADIPSDFISIPRANALNARFFLFEYERHAKDIPYLWDLAEVVVKGSPASLPEAAFAHTLDVKSNRYGKVTMGFFWLNPLKFLALDSQNTEYFKGKDIKIKNVPDLQGYLEVIDQVHNKLGRDYQKISNDAWLDGQGKGGKKPEVAGHISVWIPWHSNNWQGDPADKDLNRLMGQKVRPNRTMPEKTLFQKAKSGRSEGDVYILWKDDKEKRIVSSLSQNKGILFFVSKDYHTKEEKVIGLYGHARMGEEYSKGPKKGMRLTPVSCAAEYAILFDPEVSVPFKQKQGPANFRKVDNDLAAVILKDALVEHKSRNPKVAATLRELLDELPEGKPGPNGGNSEMKLPLNLILYGPPGTGKTYKLQTEYFKPFLGKTVKRNKQELQIELFKEASWSEVVTAALYLIGEAKVPEILQHPIVEAKSKRSNSVYQKNCVWNVLHYRTSLDCPNVNANPEKRPGPYIFWKDENSVWSIDKKKAEQEFPEIIEKLIDPSSIEESTENRTRFVTFHQSYSYEDFVEGIRPVMDDEDEGEMRYEIRNGIFKTIVADALEDPDNSYALFIDEVNRGNVAAIFGELITLIEPDKRLGEENELTVTLPYSRQKFGVPSNLHIIATMNTADRSIEALDTALRRRFDFEECPPLLSVVGKFQPESLKVDLAKLLKAMNERIERLLDKDHCIGHSYFLKIKDLEDLRRVFKQNIIPLIEEYFYGDRGKIGLVLGNAFVKVKEQDDGIFKSGDWELEEYDDRKVFDIVDVKELDIEEFVSIYA